MEKKQGTTVTTSNPSGVCEKIFHALHTNAAFRPLRRLTFRNQDANTNTSRPLIHHSPNSDTKHSSTPTKPPHPATHGKKTPSESVKTEKTGLSVPTPPPKAEAKPKAAKPKKEMNQKIDEFITRTKGKIRTGSNVGRAPPSSN